MFISSVLILILSAGLSKAAASSRVFELTDKFLDIKHEGQWLVKFYAPWCAHCTRLQPVWAHVAQELYTSPVKVARLDCTRFTHLAAHFNVKAFPTILFLKGNVQHEYTGDRIKDEMVTYALRMSQASVQHVTQGDSVGYLKETHPIFYGYIGKHSGLLWDVYSFVASKYQPHSWFYAMPNDIIRNDIKPPTEPSVFVYKDNEAHFFEANSDTLLDRDSVNATLDKWINAERFGTFPKVTRSNINELMDTEKYLVLVIVAENKLQEITQGEKDFKDMIEALIRRRKRELHHHFQFGWIGSPDLANSIAMYELSLPHLLVLNSTTNHHHMPEDDPVLMTPEAVSVFLDQIFNEIAPTYGGNSWPIRTYRVIFEARSALMGMWRGNPVLTALIFGLPLGFLSLICYSICCADILDSEDEESSEAHEKKD